MSDEKTGLTYTEAGVNYESLDPFKRLAQQAAAQTSQNLARHRCREITASRGESAYLIELPDRCLAMVEEGLGTKNLVADAMYRLTGKSYYDQAAQCTVAMIVNDLITLGALPLSVAMHLAVGSSDWFDDRQRSQDLVNGWRKACDLAQCAWGGGETPALQGIVEPKTALLSGSAIGQIFPQNRRIQDNIQPGDVIYLAESTGIHANGLTLARRIADQLPQGYLSQLDDGRTYGEALLDPTHIYVSLIRGLINGGIVPRYAINITGHGWRKLMRATHPYAYVIDQLPTQLPIFDFIQRHGPVSDHEAYRNFNMGAGFAVIVSPQQAHAVDRFAMVDSQGLIPRWLTGVGSSWVSAQPESCYRLFRAGYVEKSDQKKVVIRPKGLEYAGHTLAVR